MDSLLELKNGSEALPADQADKLKLEAKEILLVDLNSEIETKQTFTKEDLFLNGITTSLPQPKPQPPFLPESSFSANLSFFPTPNPDPFSDDPFAQPDQPALPLFDSLKSADQKKESLSTLTPAGNGASNGDIDYFGKQFDQISNRTGKREALTSQWPLESKSPAAGTPNGVPEREQNGVLKAPSNLFVEGPSKGVSLQNGVKLDSESNTQLMSHESITISPPPQSTKPGRGRRSVKVNSVQTPSVLPSVSTTTSPPQPPPRTAPQKELSKKESDAFIALDPLGDKEMKDVKEMFKDFQLTKPPAVPARRGEQQSLSGASGSFSNDFSSKGGIPQVVQIMMTKKQASCLPK
ncbi:hypothetical protein llap_21148 [Limosa lapponica baueri]|uniref:Uncharacterized protein n=1 Tax=Limosa lapponica baueri TaxID=1758121 RepID=A0A2I0T441_LIMLA|nr:hypothetical protein llap_21148 [Limosa lapponica baueri]